MVPLVPAVPTIYGITYPGVTVIHFTHTPAEELTELYIISVVVFPVPKAGFPAPPPIHNTLSLVTPEGTVKFPLPDVYLTKLPPKPVGVAHTVFI